MSAASSNWPTKARACLMAACSPKSSFDRAADLESRAGRVPSRGAIEVKGPGDEIQAIIKSKQVADYLKAYRQVLVTNLREFLLMGAAATGRPIPLEGYSLAASADSFLSLCDQPRNAAGQHSERLAEFLTRVMLQRHAPGRAQGRGLVPSGSNNLR